MQYQFIYDFMLNYIDTHFKHLKAEVKQIEDGFVYDNFIDDNKDKICLMVGFTDETKEIV